MDRVPAVCGGGGDDLHRRALGPAFLRRKMGLRGADALHLRQGLQAEGVGTDTLLLQIALGPAGLRLYGGGEIDDVFIRQGAGERDGEQVVAHNDGLGVHQPICAGGVAPLIVENV